MTLHHIIDIYDLATFLRIVLVFLIVLLSYNFMLGGKQFKNACLQKLLLSE